MTDPHALAVSVLQAHEWGYRDPAEGRFIEHRLPFDLANAVLAIGMEAAKPAKPEGVRPEGRQPGP